MEIRNIGVVLLFDGLSIITDTFGLIFVFAINSFTHVASYQSLWP